VKYEGSGSQKSCHDFRNRGAFLRPESISILLSKSRHGCKNRGTVGQYQVWTQLHKKVRFQHGSTQKSQLWSPNHPNWFRIMFMGSSFNTIIRNNSYNIINNTISSKMSIFHVLNPKTTFIILFNSILWNMHIYINNWIINPPLPQLSKFLQQLDEFPLPSSSLGLLSLSPKSFLFFVLLIRTFVFLSLLTLSILLPTKTFLSLNSLLTS